MRECRARFKRPIMGGEMPPERGLVVGHLGNGPASKETYVYRFRMLLDEERSVRSGKVPGGGRPNFGGNVLLEEGRKTVLFCSRGKPEGSVGFRPWFETHRTPIACEGG